MTNITLPRAVVEQALEALESDNPDVQLRAAIALRAALNEASKEVEPVAWLCLDKYGSLKLSQTLPHEHGAFPVFTHPAPAVPEVKEGWQLVPKEPTREMLDAYNNVAAWLESNEGTHYKVSAAYDQALGEPHYKAMLATAPEMKK